MRGSASRTLSRPEVQLFNASCYSAGMPVSISRGVYHHGKRHRFVVTAQDDSIEAFKAASAELDEQVRRFTEATVPKVVRQSYRKRKGCQG